jgi:hypothetical protein
MEDIVIMLDDEQLQTDMTPTYDNIVRGIILFLVCYN